MKYTVLVGRILFSLIFMMASHGLFSKQKIMKTTILSLTLGLLLLTIGCSSVSVMHDYDSEANFAAFKTYAWMSAPINGTGSVEAALQSNSLLDKRIKQSADRHLAAKGFTTDATSPDFLVAYHVGAQDRIDVTDWGYGYGHGRWFGGDRVDVHQFKEGTLILDIIDARTKQLVWRGIATGALDPNVSPEALTRKLDEAIVEILAKFPPTV
jgi:hypothetical protein